MKALLVWAYCLGCNSSSLSITKFDTMDECKIARTALVASAKQPGLMSDRPAFENVTEPQCVEYFWP